MPAISDPRGTNGATVSHAQSALLGVFEADDAITTGDVVDLYLNASDVLVVGTSGAATGHPVVAVSSVPAGGTCQVVVRGLARVNDDATPDAGWTDLGDNWVVV
jgi:hypothetical protein